MNATEIQETITTITQGLQLLADKLGTSADYLFKLAVKQVYIQMGQILLALVFIGIMDYIFYRFVKWGIREEKGKGYSRFDNDEYLVVLAVITGVSLLIFSVFIASNVFINIPQAIFNPEWKAIKNIMDLVTKQK